MSDEPRTIYIVTSGEYSDYSIHAVFSSKERAAAWIGQYRADYNEEYDIEEYPLDPDSGTPPGYMAFHVRMGRDGGVRGIDSSRGHESDARAHTARITVWAGKKVQLPSLTWIDAPEVETFETYMFARDGRHAIKIANERRAFLIATEQWTPGDHTEAFASHPPIS